MANSTKSHALNTDCGGTPRSNGRRCHSRAIQDGPSTIIGAIPRADGPEAPHASARAAKPHSVTRDGPPECRAFRLPFRARHGQSIPSAGNAERGRDVGNSTISRRDVWHQRATLGLQRGRWPAVGLTVHRTRPGAVLGGLMEDPRLDIRRRSSLLSGQRARVGNRAFGTAQLIPKPKPTTD